jgi:hypothetical protein
MEKIVKFTTIVTAALLLLMTFGSLRSDFEQMALWGVFASAVFTLVVAYEKNKQGWLWCMVFVAILFNPLAPVEFKRKAWQFIEVLTAIAFFMASKLP